MKKIIIGMMLLGGLFIISSCNKCDEIKPESCGGSSIKPLVDLIILIDASSSMGSVATSISNAAKNSIDSSGSLCMTDLRVKYFGVDDVWPSTVFTESHRNYLYLLHGNTIALAADRPPVTYSTEQGANAVEDLSNLFDWRPNACRAILYISDEELDGCCPNRANGNLVELEREQAEVDLAILAARTNNTSVFTHLIDKNDLDPGIKLQYQQLSNLTGGISEITDPERIDETFYIGFLENVICNSCNACSLNDFIN